MNCCSECFTSSYIKQIIISKPVIGKCDFCGNKKITIYNPSELGLIFQNILDLYKVDKKKGKPIEEQIEMDFDGKIFSNKIAPKLKDLLKEIISDDYKTYKHLFTNKVLLSYLDDTKKYGTVKPLQISWDKFAHEIISTNRFHIKNTLDLTKVEELLGRYEKHIPKGKKYFRARVSDNSAGLKIGDMKNPPPSKAKAGRANPTGISYLYMANDLKTTLYEARATLYDYVTIGTFRFKENARIITLSGEPFDPMRLADEGVLEDFLIHLPFISKLEQELSKPRRKNDNELEYLPTQYLCEFIKSIGFDGVEYQSSLNPQGYNLAIFIPDKLECIKVDVYDVSKIDMDYKLVK